MLGVNTIDLIIFWKNLHDNRVKFPEEKDAFVLDHQHDCLHMSSAAMP